MLESQTNLSEPTSSGESDRWAQSRLSMEGLELYQFQKLTQPGLLMTAQPLRLGEHSFDHFSRLAPLAINTCLHECFARPSTRTMRGDDVSDDGSKLINDSHGATSFNIDDPCLTAELASGSGWNLRLRRPFGPRITRLRPAFSLSRAHCSRNHDSKCRVSHVVDRATVKVIGGKLREKLPPPDTKSSKELRGCS